MDLGSDGGSDATEDNDGFDILSRLQNNFFEELVCSQYSVFHMKMNFF